MTERRAISRTIVLCALVFIKAAGTGRTDPRHIEGPSPRIVNIVNFIRQCEPRIDWITEDVLYETVVSQIESMERHGLRGTFLLQYDALMDTRYQTLLKALPRDRFEIGAWWEIPQPLVENSGYTWRGRYPWDWHADVGFATGYDPVERVRLVDTYMADFKKVFGAYPKSIGSWFIDAVTLNYMVERYGIVASCNCKDQIGTDGYTLWGGYWNQGYYPSIKNASLEGELTVRWPTESPRGAILLRFNERSVSMRAEGSAPDAWYFELTTDKQADLPFERIDRQEVLCSFKQVPYAVRAKQGTFVQTAGSGLRIVPEAGHIVLDFSLRGK
jgi:hypothetical protein